MVGKLRQAAGRPLLWRGWPAIFDVLHETRNRKGPEMRRPMTDRINDDSWAMGVLEPILLLLAIELIAALLGLF